MKQKNVDLPVNGVYLQYYDEGDEVCQVGTKKKNLPRTNKSREARIEYKFGPGSLNQGGI